MDFFDGEIDQSDFRLSLWVLFINIYSTIFDHIYVGKAFCSRIIPMLNSKEPTPEKGENFGLALLHK